jgi:4-amino-4-deoxy-L-arabinose transferase-like glycosyltransferase
LIVYQILRRKSAAPTGWSGWWPWLLSLAIFLAWAIGGIVSQKDFYEVVVVREFAGRFTETIHKPQPIYFYFPHILHKFAPWSVLLIGLAIFFWRRRERLSLQMKPATVWLVCWSLGGLLLMSLIPSKRVDRIYPILPPLCLLLGAQIGRVMETDRWRIKIQPWLAACLIFGILFTAGYAAFHVTTAWREKSDALVQFARAVRKEAAQQHWRYAVVGGREEGVLLYMRQDHFLAPNVAVAQWQAGQLDALVVRNQPARAWLDLLPGAKLARVSEKAQGLPYYSLFVRQP